MSEGTTQKFEIDAAQAKAALQQLIASAQALDDAFKKAGDSGDEVPKKLTWIQKATRAMKSFGSGIKTSSGHLLKLAAAAGAATVAIQKMAVEGEKAQAIAKSFAALGAKAGDLEKLRQATGNMVDDTTLQKSFNLAKFFGLNTDSLGTLTKVAQGAANALGTDMGSALSDLMTAISRKSKPILDNLGITIRNLDVVYKEYAQSIGVADYKTLTEDQKTAAFQAEALANAQKQLNLASLDVEKSARQAQAAWENFKSELASGAMEIFADIWDGLQKISEAAREAARQLADVGIGDRAGLKQAQGQADEAQKRWARVNEELSRSVDGYAGSAEGSQVWKRSILETREELFNAALTLERWKREGRDLTEAQDQFDRIRRRLEEVTAAQNEFNNETREYATLLAGVITDATKGEVERLKELERREKELAQERKRRAQERERQLQKQLDMLGQIAIKTKISLEGALGEGFGRKQINPLKELLGEGFGEAGFMDGAKEQATSFFGDVSALAQRAVPSLNRYKDAAVDITKAEEAKRKATVNAAVSGAVAVGKGALAQIASKEQLAAIEGAIQVGYAIAAGVTGDIAGAIGHGAAAAQFFIAAGTSGGGGASSSGGGGRSSAPSARREIDRLDNERGGGGTTLIIENKGLYIDDEQAMRIGRGIQRYQQLGGRMG